MRKATYALKMAKCSWNVIRLDNSCNVWKGKGQDFFLCLFGYELKNLLTKECSL
jgi:hypothetical protein